MDLMVDIETLGTDRNSAICSVGWAVFDESQVVTSWVVRMDWNEQLHEFCRRIDPNTLRWWLEQTPAAQSHLVHMGVEVRTERLHELLQETIRHNNIKTVWANGPGFDLKLLDDLFTNVGRPTPWAYRQERDYRTMRDIARLWGINVDSVGIAHNAEHDAINQANLVIAVRNALKKQTGEK